MPEVKLDVPYHSQDDPTEANFSFNDCGPTCVAMMAEAIGYDLTVNQVYKDNNFWSKGLIGVSTIANMLNHYGVDVRVHSDYRGDSGLVNLRGWLDEGRPALILMWYYPIRKNRLCHPRKTFTGGHFVNVVGYRDADVFYVHDPLWPGDEGAYREWPTHILDYSWVGVSGDQYVRYAIVPKKRIAHPVTPPYEIPPETFRRIKAWAAYYGVQVPTIRSEADYTATLGQMGTWGQTATDYTCQQGDTMASIAESQLGDPDLFHVIAAYNDIAANNPIRIGQVIGIPSLPEDVRPTGAGFTNQEVINAFYEVHKDRNAPAGAYFDAIEAAGIEGIVTDRQAPYTLTPIAQLPNLDPAIKSAVLSELTGSTQSQGWLRDMKAAYHFTNQQVINAFYDVLGARGMENQEIWEMMVAAGLSYLAKDRNIPYNGPEISDILGLDANARAAIAGQLGLEVPAVDEDADEIEIVSGDEADKPGLDTPVDPPAEKEVEELDLTNQQVINAFFHTFKERGAGENDYWLAMQEAGLESIAALRDQPYTGPAILELPHLEMGVKQAVVDYLRAETDHQYTNRDVINAFYYVYKKRDAALTAYWDALVRTGLAYLAEDRHKVYTGPDIDDLPNLDAGTKREIKEELNMMVVPAP